MSGSKLATNSTQMFPGDLPVSNKAKSNGNRENEYSGSAIAGLTVTNAVKLTHLHQLKIDPPEAT